jgi:hypothetical protein
MKSSALTFVLVVSAALILIAADRSTVQPNGLTIHEWGTFTSVADEDGSAVDWDALGCKSDLPGFVNAAGYRGFMFRLEGPVRMETPVMYSYSLGEVVAHVQVRFPYGVITEWYPNGDNAIYESKSLMDQMHINSPESAIYQTKSLIYPTPARLDSSLVRLSPNLNGIDTSLRHLMGAIGWSDVKVQPASAPAFPVESAPSCYYAARATDAAPISVGNQHEKFLFYRGAGRFQPSLSARLSEEKVTVENRGSDPVPAVFLFENRGGRLGLGYRNAGTLTNAVTLDRPLLDGSFLQLLHDLETTLIAQGLFPKEAQAMVDTWRDSWFEEGSRLIYIVPTQAIEAILPLQVEPAPLQTARVFVGRIELITPETRRTVEQALAKGDWSTVDRYSRFLDPILQRILTQDPARASQIEQFRRSNPRCQ